MYDNLKKKFGQNFLIDKNILNKIINLIKKNDLRILEIGPGSGLLTDFILKKKPNKLTLIEIDKDLINLLENKFKNFDFVKIINFDFLKIDIQNKYDLIVSNLPYNISSQILAKFCTINNKPDEMILMFQKEFADKLMEKKLNSLNALVNCFYKMQYEFRVSRNYFRPIPKIDSAVLSFRKIKKPLITELQVQSFILFKRAIFSHKRKKIKSSIVLNKEILNLEYLDKRPEDLSMNELLKLFFLSNL